jgi:putative colanic acid biosynthesis acetyltransferase WcaF
MIMQETKEIWLKHSQSPFTFREKIRLSMWLFIYKIFIRVLPHKLNFIRISILRLFGANIGKGCFVHQSAYIYMPWNLEMGNYSSIDFDAIIYSYGKVTIGDFVSISYKVNINTASHDYTDPKFTLTVANTLIESGAFIGTETYLSPGVKIGKMAVIGARSVVTKDMPSDYVCFGCPCKPYKKRVKNEK